MSSVNCSFGKVYKGTVTIHKSSNRCFFFLCFVSRVKCLIPNLESTTGLRERTLWTVPSINDLYEKNHRQGVLMDNSGWFTACLKRKEGVLPHSYRWVLCGSSSLKPALSWRGEPPRCSKFRVSRLSVSHMLDAVKSSL